MINVPLHNLNDVEKWWQDGLKISFYDTISHLPAPQLLSVFHRLVFSVATVQGFFVKSKTRPVKLSGLKKRRVYIGREREDF